MSLQMPRPKKRSQIAKRLYAQRCANTEVPPLPLEKMAEAAPLPLKKSKAEVQPLPLKTMAEVRSPPLNKKAQGTSLPFNNQGTSFVFTEGTSLPLYQRTSHPQIQGTSLPLMEDMQVLLAEVQSLPLEEMAGVPPLPLKQMAQGTSFLLERGPVLPLLENYETIETIETNETNLKQTRQKPKKLISMKLDDNALNVLIACDKFPQKLVLKGSFNQADARFGDSRNRQCGAISLTAVLKSKMKNVLTWTAQDLDGVLVAGTRLYSSLRKQGNISDREVKGRNYIAVHELPRRHVLGNTAFFIEYTESLTGFVNVNDYSEYDESISGVAMPLDVALQRALLSADALLLTICANTSAVIKQGSWYAVVDSHAIKTETSCIVYHRTIESLYNYINDVAQLFGEPEPPFEITGVLVHADAKVSDPLEEAGSSSFPCSSGKPLYSEVLKRTPKVCESVKTEVRTSDYRVPVDEVANTRSTNLPTQTACNVLLSRGKRGRKRKQNEHSDKQVETVVTDDIIITDVSAPDVFYSPLTLWGLR